MRKIIVNGIVLGIALFFWLSCHKALEAPVGGLSNSPVFHIAYKVNSDTGSVTAGKDGYYMFTTCPIDKHGILVPQGEFRQVDCPSGQCGPALGFEFRNLFTDPVVLPDTLFYSGNHEIAYDVDSTTFNFNTIIVVYKDVNGQGWRSDLHPQQGNLFFNVISSVPYQKNENGLNTRKLEISLRCQMFNDSLIDSKIITCNGIIAVGYQ
jgi:hypothetical protein